ncbi:MAG TPA: DUF4407 domain-containing protein, partial [Pseudonocardiaceae bacterium]|nr:DUF4407 domain-containing protein [Pseudonocardiaceae bacterium]
ARLAGADSNLLLQAKTDRIRYNAMGGVLITTACMAAVSSTFALTTAVHLPIAVAIIGGLLWGLVIFNLDRMLIVSMHRQAGALRNVLTAIPRAALAVVIGLVISVPLVLQIFRPEVTNELNVIHTQNLTSELAKIDREYSDIPGLQAKVDNLQSVASGQSQPSVSSDPDVADAQNQVDQAQAAYNTAANAAQCELNGTCGSHVPGVGTAYRQAAAEAALALQRLSQAKQTLAQATSKAESRITGSARSNQAAARTQLAILGPQLQNRENGKAAAIKSVTDSENGTDGLLVRIQALGQLASDSPSMWWAEKLLALLFLLVELLPVLVKLLSMIGPPTLYDRILHDEEDHLHARAAGRIDLADQIDEHGRAEQLRLGKDARTLLAEKQFELAKDAIDVWHQVAKSRTDDELARWYARHAGLPQPHGRRNQTPPAGGVAQPTQPLSPAGRPTQPQPAGWAQQTVPFVPVTGGAQAPQPQPGPGLAAARPGSYRAFKASVGSPPTNNGRSTGHPPAGPVTPQP